MDKVVIIMWRLIFVLALAVVTYISLAPSVGGGMFVGMDKLMHCFTYACLYVLAWLAFPGPILRVRIHIALLAFGVGLELLQARTGYRFMEAADVLANTTGTGMGNLILSFVLASPLGQRNFVFVVREDRK